MKAKSTSKKERIWELDAFRGICILCVVLVHFVFDLQYFAGFDLEINALFRFVMDYGGALFIILSGVCVTLGSNSVRRGIIVFAFGMVITLVTQAMVWLNMAQSNILIQFGVLHLLGFCMMVYPLFKGLKTPIVGLFALIFIALGYYFIDNILVQQPYLFVLGLRSATFSSSDYFPILPHLGWFLCGVVLGRTAYKNKKTLLPKVPSDGKFIGFFSTCGRQSLWIYMFHQPIVYAIVLLIIQFT